ncbi:hypothetical protein FF011L_54590 [Roseimaritima multifibrata]|uniref:DUF2752 domain-containing protein n=1 Tax=Roseimaritima multifibrata TaxID=1930274 RepID=A0A517MPE4_9BACT|nr:DUF2752 domain-containing protein [Roseimaritima multifibrata]QDS96647.1 hypothetical protein FF011L_54590 [Roseimaritima multifibrata]
MPGSAPSSTLPAVAEAGWFLRLVWLVFVIGLAGLLVTAWRLQPNPTGMGTHQQLGLPPCSIVVLWGVRCPACGMTTSWAYFTDGHWWTSWCTNPGGFLFAVIATVAVPWLAYLAVTGKRGPNWSLPLLAGVLIVGLAVTLGDWAIRLLS